MIENLLNKKFNFLTVIDGPIKKNNKTYWKCKCDCGKEKIIRSDQLKSGKTKSCGCYKDKIFIENNKKRQTLDLTNKQFGKLTAIQPTNKRKDQRVVWLCKCECGNYIEVDSHSLQEGKTTSCGCLRSQGEYIISTILKNNNIPFIVQASFNTCRFPDNNYLARFDFYIDNKYLIEYDGQQHFWFKDNPHTWNNESNYKKVLEHDKIKNQWCKENNIPLIRIPYTHLNDLCLEDLLLETSKFIV